MKKKNLEKRIKELEKENRELKGRIDDLETSQRWITDTMQVMLDKLGSLNSTLGNITAILSSDKKTAVKLSDQPPFDIVMQKNGKTHVIEVKRSNKTIQEPAVLQRRREILKTQKPTGQKGKNKNSPEK